MGSYGGSFFGGSNFLVGNWFQWTTFLGVGWEVALGVALGSYGTAYCLFLSDFILHKKRLASLAIVITVLAFIAHFFSLALKGAITGKLPFGTFSEIASCMALLFTGIYLELERRMKLKGLGLFITLLAFTALFFSVQIASKSDFHLNPQLSGVWFRLHTIALFVSYSTFTVAFSTSLIYLLQENLLKNKYLAYLSSRLPSLNMLDMITNQLVIIAFPFLTLGLIAGAVWAGQIWEHYWEWEPKQTFALITWIVYGCYTIIRTVFGWKGRKVMLLNVVGFLFLLVTFLGVNLFMPGKHKFI